MDVKVLASGSSGNCYRVSDGTTAVLLDAGISIKRIREGCGFNLGGISGCMVTHMHGDHSKAVRDLLKAGVEVYMPKKEIAAMGLEHHHRLHYLADSTPGTKSPYLSFRVGTFYVTPFPIEHDTPEPVGYVLLSILTKEKLLYFTDTYYIKWRFRGLNYIIGEANYTEEELWEHIEEGSTGAARAKRLFTSHMSLDTFIGFLKANDMSGIKQIYICHMSDDHGDERKIKDAVQRETGAEVYIC